MAEEGRGSLTSKMNSNIYDNNAKEIDPQKVRNILAALIESNFNLVDDFLQSVNYSPGVTLEEQINNAAGTNVLLHSKSGVIPVRTANEGQFYNGDGNATFKVSANDGNHDDELFIEVTFPNLGTSNYMPIVAFEVTGTPWHDNNAVIVTWASPQSSTLRVYLQRVYDNPFGRIWVTLIKLPD